MNIETENDEIILHKNSVLIKNSDKFPEKNPNYRSCMEIAFLIFHNICELITWKFNLKIIAKLLENKRN